METNENQPTLENVADGQAVVNAVAQDTQVIVDGAVERIGALMVQSDESGSMTCQIGDDQWAEMQGHMRLAATSSMLNAFAAMAIFGAVCAGYVVKGWRRD